MKIACGMRKMVIEVSTVTSQLLNTFHSEYFLKEFIFLLPLGKIANMEKIRADHCRLHTVSYKLERVF